MKKEKKLGNDPLSWIGNNNHDSKENISQTTEKHSTAKIKKQERKDKEVRRTLWLTHQNSENVDNYAYWERMTIKEVINAALQEYFKNKNVVAKD